MKDFFKIIIASIIVGMIGGIGTWGIYTFSSNTEVGWKIWGLALATVVFIIPWINFWNEKVSDIMDLD